MIIFPAIDVLNGKCVRLSQGDFSKQKVYAENPLDMALTFEKAGIKNLHLVDLDGAKAGQVVNWDVVKSITSSTSLKVDFGGGNKTETDIEKLFQLGVTQVNLGSIAAKQPLLVKEWIKKYGNEKIILSADCKDEKLAVSGWQSQTSISVIDFIRDFVSAGLKHTTCTDISQDGMLSGPNVKLYQKIIKTLATNNPVRPGQPGGEQLSTINLIASGGVSSKDDLKKLQQIGCYGCIVGKAYYEGRIQLNDLASGW